MSDQTAEASTIKPIGSVASLQDVEATRTQFVQLLLANPNHFGTMPEVGKPAAIKMSGNTSYEQLACLGLNPQADRLEAVVNLKQSFGYLGNACTSGSTEYVRFFVQRGATWVDLGEASFKGYDIAGSHPISYAVAVSMDEARKLCKTEQIVNVRAILSWNHEPPAGNASWTPVWGNVVDSRVQIAPLQLAKISIGDLVNLNLLTLEDQILPAVDPSQTLATLPTQPMTFDQLKVLYAKSDVPTSRFGFKQALAATKAPVTAAVTALHVAAAASKALVVAPVVAPIAGAAAQLVSPSLILDPNLAAILQQVTALKTDTTYEELTCAGFNPGSGFLEAVLSIKSSAGYSGGLCSAGSTEYVGFWVQYNGTWHALGVATVQVHDLAGVGGGKSVQYGVVRAANLPVYDCKTLAGLPLRAILSWEQPPTGPDYIPHWGNVVNTFVQPPVGQPDPAEGHLLRLMRIGRITTSGISDATGRGTKVVSDDCDGDDSPFGGLIFVEGYITNELNVFDPNSGDVLAGQHPLKYQVSFSKVGVSGSTPVANPFTVQVWPQTSSAAGGVTKTIASTPEPSDGHNYFTYMEGPTQPMNPRTLAVWDAGALAEGLYQITVVAFAWNGAQYVQTDSQSKNVYVFNGYPHIEQVAGPNNTILNVNVQAPEVHLSITSPGGDCADFVENSSIDGTFSVTDHFFGSYGIAVTPITVNGIIQTPNAVVVTPTSSNPNTGVSGTWHLPLAGMVSCGYTVVLSSWDRALVSNNCSGHYNQTAVGFCVSPKAPPS